MSWREINFDGLVGPTHNYAGLSFGNLASSRNRDAVSNPRAAALEGLEKMKQLLDLGVAQAVLPPLPRPDLATLKRLGFSGTPQQMLERAWRTAPDIFSACCSASSMWSANAATVAPSCDTADGRLHVTPANLLANFHRSIEAPQTAALLRSIFNDEKTCTVHDPLPPFAGFADEGAANHMRLGTPGQKGVHVFVYGTADHQQSPTKKYPARQTLAAAQAVARLNQLPADNVMFVQQNPDAIDAGAFHNDVVAVSHHHHLFCHEQAFVDQPGFIDRLRKKLAHSQLKIHQVSAQDIPLDMVVSTYLFNSQIVTLGNGDAAMILPVECDENPQVKQYVSEKILGNGFVQQIQIANVRQSMRNGGGPACLRLRVLMNENEIERLQGKALLTQERYTELKKLISTRYPDHLQLADLRDAALAQSLYQVTEECARILGIATRY